MGCCQSRESTTPVEREREETKPLITPVANHMGHGPIERPFKTSSETYQPSEPVRETKEIHKTEHTPSEANDVASRIVDTIIESPKPRREEKVEIDEKEAQKLIDVEDSPLVTHTPNPLPEEPVVLVPETPVGVDKQAQEEDTAPVEESSKTAPVAVLENSEIADNNEPTEETVSQEIPKEDKPAANNKNNKRNNNKKRGKGNKRN